MRKLVGAGSANPVRGAEPKTVAKSVVSVSTRQQPAPSNRSAFSAAAATAPGAQSGVNPAVRRGASASVNAFKGLTGFGERLKRGVSTALLGVALATNLAGCAREPTVERQREQSAQVYDTQPAEAPRPPQTPDELADAVINSGNTDAGRVALNTFSAAQFMGLPEAKRSQVVEAGVQDGVGAFRRVLFDGQLLRANPQAAAALAETLLKLPQEQLDWVFQAQSTDPRSDGLSVLARTIALRQLKASPLDAPGWARLADAWRPPDAPQETGADVLSQSKGVKHLDAATATKVRDAVAADAKSPLERSVQMVQLLENPKLGPLSPGQKTQLLEVALAAPAASVGELNRLLSINSVAKKAGLMEPVFDLQGDGNTRSMLTELHRLIAAPQALGETIHGALPEVKQQAMAKQLALVQYLTPQQAVSFQTQLGEVLKKDPSLAKALTEAQSLLAAAGGDGSKLSEHDEARVVELADVLDNSRPLMIVLSAMFEAGQANADAAAAQLASERQAENAARDEGYQEGERQAQADADEATAQRENEVARARQQDFRRSEAAQSLAYGVAGAALDQHARQTGSGAAAFGSGIAGALSVVHGVRAIRGY